MQKLTTEEAAATRGTARRVVAEVERAVVGKSDVIEMMVIALLARGHVLIEDIPGVGKTTLAKAVAKAVGGTFKRIQFTPDLLPGDVTGMTIYNQKFGEFSFNPGPIFANVVLADEINRATPKTQSALLESMEEAQATTDGTTRALPQPFFVIATQNPIEYRGTYPLPEAQMDRFLMRIAMGYPRREEEIEMLERHLEAGAPPELSRHGSEINISASGALNGVVPVGAGGDSSNEATTSQAAALLESVGEVLSAEDTRALQRDRMRVWVSPAVREYIVAITHGTREGFNVTLGVSPRGSLALQRAAQAAALLAGREFATPDDVKKLALPVLSHRLIMQGHEGRDHSAAESLLQRLLDETPVPRGHNEPGA